MATKPIYTDLDFTSGAKLVNVPNPTSAQDAATKGYVDSAVEGLAWKDSVRVKTQANINLASPGASIDSVSMATNDRFLAADQTAPEENGIYIWNGAATPATRAPDASTAAELEQAVVTVEEGTDAATTWRQTEINITLGTDDVLFVAFGTAAAAASETVAGVIEIANQSEVDTGTDNGRAVTPQGLTGWSGRKLKYSASVGDGSSTSIALTHNLGTRDVQVGVYRNSGNYDEIMCEVRHTDTNTVTLLFAAAPSSNQFRAVILG